ncbi:hypothetical protein pdam_00004894 [Pocillopora damicornis]|uniref:Thiamin pyrophosphokinase catalytic domain-containing protein n=1 Tax=Pocillopora damicornis TaxID=46731 RepID=A0A3M6TM38_POCDA|nr:hypothetical protein pdam_00004894 [Pocillopora damicornis]
MCLPRKDEQRGGKCDKFRTARREGRSSEEPAYKEDLDINAFDGLQLLPETCKLGFFQGSNAIIFFAAGAADDKEVHLVVFRAPLLPELLRYQEFHCFTRDVNYWIMATEWTPLACLSSCMQRNKDKELKVALIVINMPLGGMFDKFKKLCNIASVKSYTDGGSSQVFNIVGEEQEKYLPDYISGDFDSVDPDILNFYKGKGVEIIPTPDQNETDLTKCLRILISNKSISEFDQIVVMNAFGGRLDHTMANIETMFHITKLTNKPLYLMSEDSVACLLMPVNTGDGQLEFGTLVSTSNTYDGSGVVTIETDTTVLWTMGVK